MISFLGLCVQNFIQTLKYILGGNVKWKNVMSQAAMISYDSLPIALSIVFIAAVVIALQVSKQFLMTGAESYVGGFLAVALIRELAPGFAALAISARAGTAISAEIANMQVTSQVDAIKTLKVDPIGYYFAPRIISGAITVPMVVILAELFGILGGMIISYYAIDLHPNRYMSSVWLWLNTRDIYISILRGFVFGIIIPLVCATQGYKTSGGAKNVGISTTKAAIKTTVFLLMADLIITFIFYVC
ncbi:TPA: ABC transporter permease [Candidatus Avigastranaerophilus faecigallinarum]|nr:ABC transporter permease [Candidatus Avigastranaerophilus faecigallinarum]